jgi:hypothetical protein
MHSRIQYLSAALLWDTLFAEKYRGMSALLLVNLLFQHGSAAGLSNDFYASLVGDPQADEHFQAQVRMMHDMEARRLGLTLRPEDEFQLIGIGDSISGVGESLRHRGPFLTGSSQLALQLDDTNYTFSLQMTGQDLDLRVVQGDNDDMFGPVGPVFHLSLVSVTTGSQTFYQTKFSVTEAVLPVNGLLVKLLDGLVKLGSSSRLQSVIYHWINMVRAQKEERLAIAPSDEPRGTITIG